MKKTISIFLSILTFLICFFPSAKSSVWASPESELTLYADKDFCTFLDRNIPLTARPFECGGKVHIPLEDILPHLGFYVDWDTNQSAYVLTRGGEVSFVYPSRFNIWVGGDEFIFPSKPFVINGKTFVSEDLFSALTGYRADAKGNLPSYSFVTLSGGDKFCFVNGKKVDISQNAVINNYVVFLPIEETLPALGFSMEWDANQSAYVLTKNGVVSYLYPKRNNIWVGPDEYVFPQKPITVNGRVLISDQMFASLTGAMVNYEGLIPLYRDRTSINSSKRTDAYRLAGNSIVSGGGVTVVDGFGMEIPWFTDSSALAYASVINSVAASLPENIDVYNIVVPTSAEFYAPSRLYPNQLSGIKTAYNNLSERVTPVNIYDTLAEHGNEAIYFRTDHHWTQKGAYYAYKEFMKYFDVTVDDLSTFKNVPAYSHVGSFGNFARGTGAGAILQRNPEPIDRFLPKYGGVGTVYYDHYLSRKGFNVNAVNTGVSAYHGFIGGDNPVTVFNTSAPLDRTLVIVKESYGNALATWAINSFKKVVVVDPRQFNGFSGHNTYFNLKTLCQSAGATDVLFINYPIAASSSPIRNAILKLGR